MSGTFRVFLRALSVSLGASMLIGAAAPIASAHVVDNAFKQRMHVKSRAESEVGTPYRYGGTSPSGFDCSGFTMWVFSDHGAKLPHSSIDQFYLPKHRDNYRRIWKRSKLKVGDLVFHKTTSRRVGHAGVFIGNGKFISSTSSSGVRVRSLWDRYYWGPRWVGAVRVPANRT